ncbi:hypothetical protein Mro03_64320 [Microbispora rosea subsp. rosea]|nr:hypothetical protein Mro03_64320 [Microbispora rosea subsp. rosea]
MYALIELAVAQYQGSTDFHIAKPDVTTEVRTSEASIYNIVISTELSMTEPHIALKKRCTETRPTIKSRFHKVNVTKEFGSAKFGYGSEMCLAKPGVTEGRVFSFFTKCSEQHA